MADSQKLSEIFKSEYSNLLAVLINYYGLRDLQFAEDIVSETFYKATKVWSHKGIPQNPRAWLRKVAQNLVYEDFRRKKIFEDKISRTILQENENSVEALEITDQLIEDSQLRMMFLLCDPELKPEAQLCIALRILCGFSTEEIANALLSNKESVNKKLYRAKKSIRTNFSIDTELSPSDFESRLDNVLRVIYLLFNEGYYSSVLEDNIRHDLCWEAMRLGIFLTKQERFDVSHAHALVALMCFHASRFNARASGEHGDLLYHEQDKREWNQDLIKKGEQYLKKASKSNTITKYHLEANIAFWHTQEHENKWVQILMLYDKLLSIENSAHIAMNRSYALAKANSPVLALKEASKLDLKDNAHYFCLMAELYRMNDNSDQEIKHLNKALKLVNKENEGLLIRRKLERALMDG